MKFTDGYWHIRPEVTAHWPAEAYEITVAADALTVYAPTKPVVTRGATLNTPLIMVRFSSPMANVIRVQIYHFKGGQPRRPAFA